ncbi:hypothetical protein HFO55_21510 [Rhizobium leguminosarum]|uniref:hypothetical protein n=1 Tax=Rhizobium leguminosarum TaxID=384 RepID=UPI001C953B65|nr:hypothetical protein [Rhizobium leguminosarum]MBY5569803.1 hypothetical protein [Rhizobium leguminosarum]MBY5575825.1 hypothetical protein [Rhizobium leguminosarum]
MTLGSPNFQSSDMNAPVRAGETNGPIETHGGKKLNKFRAQTLASEKFHLFRGKNPWI